MCMSPHEIPTWRIEELVATMRETLASGRLHPQEESFWTGRLENYEKLLKERAEAGTL